MELIELIFREFGDGMQEVRSSILLISTIKNTITTRFMSRVVIFFQSAACALRTAYDLRLASRPYLKPDNFV